MNLLHCILISFNAVMVLSYSTGSKRGVLEETDKKGDVKVKEFTEQVDAVRNLDDFTGLHHNINKNIDQDILVKDKKKDENNIIFDDQELYTESGRRWFSMVYQLLRKYALGDKTSLVPIF